MSSFYLRLRLELVFSNHARFLIQGCNFRVRGTKGKLCSHLHLRLCFILKEPSGTTAHYPSLLASEATDASRRKAGTLDRILHWETIGEFTQKNGDIPEQ